MDEGNGGNLIRRLRGLTQIIKNSHRFAKITQYSFVRVFPCGAVAK